MWFTLCSVHVIFDVLVSRLSWLTVFALLRILILVAFGYYYRVCECGNFDGTISASRVLLGALEGEIDPKKGDPTNLQVSNRVIKDSLERKLRNSWNGIQIF